MLRPFRLEAPVRVELTMSDLQSDALATWLRRHRGLSPDFVKTMKSVRVGQVHVFCRLGALGNRREGRRRRR